MIEFICRDLTNQYGFIKFTETENESSSRLSRFIRLALETESEKVVQFLKDGWDLSTPDLIISITGGGRRCRLSKYLRKTFQRGIVAAAQTTSMLRVDLYRVYVVFLCKSNLFLDAWLITAGTDAGIMREVGRALNNYRYKNDKKGLDITCIGIASWDYTAGTEQLQEPINGSPISANKIQDTFSYSNATISRMQHECITIVRINRLYLSYLRTDLSRMQAYENIYIHMGLVVGIANGLILNEIILIFCCSMEIQPTMIVYC